MARTKFSSYLPDDDEESGVDRAISALSLANSGESSDAGIHRFTEDEVDRAGQQPFGMDKPLRLDDLPDGDFDKPLHISDLPDDGASDKPGMAFSLQDASDGLFSARNKAMRDAGGSNAPVEHKIDPRNAMSPEVFEVAASGRGDDGGWQDAKKGVLDRALAPKTLDLSGDPDPRSPDSKPVVEKTTISLASPPDHVGALSEAFDKTSGKKPAAVIVDDGKTGFEGVKPADYSDSGDSPFGKLSGWALLADALLNRGKNAGQIAAMAQQQSAQERHDKLSAKNSALQDEKTRAEIKHINTQTDWQGDRSALDWEGVRQRQAQLDQGTQRVGLAADKWGQQTSADSDLNKTKPIVAGNIADAAVRGREAAKHDLNPQIADDAAKIARERTGASTDAREDTTHDNAARTAADAAVQSGMVAKAAAEGALPTQKTLKATPSPTEQRAADNEALARSPLPGLEVDDKVAYDKANLTPEMSDKNRSLLNSGNGAIDALGRAIETQKKYAGRMSTFETDPEVSKALRSSQDDVEHAIGAIGKANDLGVLNAGEYPRIAERALKPGEWSRSLMSDAAVNALSGSHKDSVLESLEGMRTSLIEAQNSTLKLMGARRAEAPSVVVPEGEGNPGKLPVMKFDTKPDKVSAVIGQTPDSSAQPPPDGGPLDISGTFDIQDPNGRVYKKTLSKGQLDLFLRKNQDWRLVSP